MSKYMAVDLIQHLQAAAQAAIAEGREDVAKVLLERAEAIATHAGQLGASPDAGLQVLREDDVASVVKDWGALSPTPRYFAKGVLLLDCGNQGQIVIAGGVVSLDDKQGPEARLLMAKHAQRHWNNKILLYGTPEQIFWSGVACEMVGVEVVGYAIPQARRAEAEALKLLWEPKLRAIEGNPVRPQSRGGRSQPDRPRA